MKVIFICPGGNSCRSLIAKTVLLAISEEIEVFSYGMEKMQCSDQFIFDLMEEYGYKIETTDTSQLDDHNDVVFDYLITIYDMNKEKLSPLPFKYIHKLHLDFAAPNSMSEHYLTKVNLYKHLIEEIKVELEYFYYHMLRSDSVV
ncbi:arsenate reductase/protein-tyrosine-phosphatase family protein [Sunxiuqinia sp. A32]|uniref:arsenate reductase/protein-tyrosine-phosphatase family protein n=1 Tax=Sunxiuqinia sp. A32 TaxID=3461496 RepID=UPI0040467EEE